jgi:D-alanine-D-alanine ligase
VISALDREKYEVVPVAITREGKWLTGITPKQLIAGMNQPVITGTDVDGRVEPVTTADDSSGMGLAMLAVGKARADMGAVDIVIPVLHGTYGEDGTVQGLLELANVPYVGAGVLGSALGMDKVMMKTVLAQHGVTQARFWSCLRREWENNASLVLETVEKNLGYPCFVKPANLGSSVGINKAHNREQLAMAMDMAAKYDRKIIIEENIDAREVEVSVLGNDDPIASLPGEIIPCKEFYDYEAKYHDGMARLEIPADLPLDMITQLQELAVKVFKALDCSGLARVDFFIRKSDNDILVNEINTMPGFTQFSMFPKLWEATGISYQELLERLIGLAIERHLDKNRTKTDF